MSRCWGQLRPSDTFNGSPEGSPTLKTIANHPQPIVHTTSHKCHKRDRHTRAKTCIDHQNTRFRCPTTQVPKQGAAGERGARHSSLPCTRRKADKAARRWRCGRRRRPAPPRWSCHLGGGATPGRGCRASGALVITLTVESAPACRPRRPHQLLTCHRTYNIWAVGGGVENHG